MAHRSSYEAQLKGYDAAFVNGDCMSRSVHCTSG